MGAPERMLMVLPERGPISGRRAAHDAPMSGNLIGASVLELERRGLVERDGDSLSLTERGREVRRNLKAEAT